VDVPPTNVTQYTVKGLMLGTEYEFLVMARNRLGDGQYTKDGVRSSTSSECLVLMNFARKEIDFLELTLF
jgi:hypothetical protein